MEINNFSDKSIDKMIVTGYSNTNYIDTAILTILIQQY